MKTKEIGVVNSGSGKLLLVSQEAFEKLAKKLQVSAEILADEAKAVQIDFGKPINVGVDRKSTRLNSSHSQQSRMPSSA